MSEALYQKLGVAVNRLALDLLTRQEGERIPSISEYQEKFRFSRGTIQNALAFLKESDAVDHRHLTERESILFFPSEASSRRRRFSRRAVVRGRIVAKMTKNKGKRRLICSKIDDKIKACTGLRVCAVQK